MGRSKAQLTLGKRTLTDLQVARMWEAGASEVLLSVRNERGQPRRSDCRLIADGKPGRGPLGGLHACLAAMKTRLLLTCAVDLPLLDSLTLARIVRGATPGKGFVYRNSQGWFEPLLAVYPQEILSLTHQQLEDDSLSLQSLLKRAVAAEIMEARPLPKSLEIRLTNLNAPKDLAHVLVHFPELG